MREPPLVLSSLQLSRARQLAAAFGEGWALLEDDRIDQVILAADGSRVQHIEWLPRAVYHIEQIALGRGVRTHARPGYKEGVGVRHGGRWTNEGILQGLLPPEPHGGRWEVHPDGAVRLTVYAWDRGGIVPRHLHGRVEGEPPAARIVIPDTGPALERLGDLEAYLAILVGVPAAKAAASFIGRRAP